MVNEEPLQKDERGSRESRSTDYFTPTEFKRVIDGPYAYGDWKGGEILGTAPCAFTH